MTAGRSNPGPLVMTEAEPVPPPDVTVPEPSSSHSSSSTEGSMDPQVLLEVKALADRVGGLEKLRDLVDTLLKIRP